MALIKAQYRLLLEKWHPDKAQGECQKSNEMTLAIIEAYRVLTEYCRLYPYSFSREAVNETLSPEQWWHERFGNDPVWGKPGKGKNSR